MKFRRPHFTRLRLVALAGTLVIACATAMVASATAVVAGTDDKNQASPAQARSLAGFWYVQSPVLDSPKNSQRGGSVVCPEGRPVTGGGVQGFSASTNQEINSSFPIDGGDADDVRDDGWRAYVNNGSDRDSTFQVYAICALPSS